MSSTTHDSAGDRNQEYDHDDAVEYIDGRPVDDWNAPWNLGDLPGSSGEFGRKHGIYYWALPFKYRDGLSPYEAISNIATFLQGRRATRRQVSRAALNTASNAENTAVDGLEEIALIHGWWHGGERRTTGDYYCNPNYPHPFDDEELLGSDPIIYEETIDQREEIVRQAASLGLSSAVLVPVFDVSCSRVVTNWCLDHGIQYSELRRDGMETMARTWKTINHWGKEKTEIAETFNLPLTTFLSRLKYAEDFEPPDEPSIPSFDDGGGS